ncbi:hypothetical protein Q7C36_023344 [Tachysurus vachellii]|uniref:Uncharacterized protein n=1 Tax=Tachysurus vachellii TaxID=175792 RepID=A0AA88IHY5_TACVA|nr:hypothetical protein Q7C36_023344 [Tachysurus vachellii]
MVPEMKEGLKKGGWFQKLQQRKNIKRRQYLEKEIERLEIQLRDSKVREARLTEVINTLMKERVKRNVEEYKMATMQVMVEELEASEPSPLHEDASPRSSDASVQEFHNFHQVEKPDAIMYNHTSQ